MNDWGLTTAGFKPKTFHVIKEEIESALRSTVDKDLRFTPDTIAGQLTGIIANQIRQVWEMAAGLYASLDSNTASGRALDALCALGGTYRKQAAPSRVVIQVTLAAGARLPKGILIADESNTSARFKIEKEVKNDTNEQKTFSAEAVAEENGPIYVEAGKLTKVVTPHAGLIAINNPDDALPGRFVESDADLCVRRIKELCASGSSTEGALSARLLKIKGVEAVYIEEHDHGFCAYVLGGDDQEIAETLWQHKALGVHTYGSITREVKASNGQLKSINFDRPKAIELSLHLKLKVKSSLSAHELTELANDIARYCKDEI